LKESGELTREDIHTGSRSWCPLKVWLIILLNSNTINIALREPCMYIGPHSFPAPYLSVKTENMQREDGELADT